MHVRLDEIREQLTRSDVADWYRLDSGGGVFDPHRMGAVFREDVDLTVRWGWDVYDDEDRASVHFEWASNFMSPRVRAYWFDVFWRGTVVDRYAVASVDGAHGLVPLPSTGGEEPNWFDFVTEREVAVAKLVSDLSGGYRTGMFDYYLGKAGFRVVPDED